MDLPSTSSAAPSASLSALVVPPPAPSVPTAPPEAIATDIKAVESAFQAAGNARFLDLSGRFTFDDRAKITTAVNELSQKTGSKVWVLALPGKTDVNNYAAIHNEMKMQQKDVLLIISADKRHLHSQAIPKTVGNDILKDTNAAFYKTSQTSGVLAMLDQVSVRLANAAPVTTASTGAPGQPAGAKKPALPLDGILVLIAIAAIGWMLFKNRTPPKAPGKSDKPG